MRRVSRAAAPTTPPGIDALHACYGKRFSYAFYKHMVSPRRYLPSMTASVARPDRKAGLVCATASLLPLLLLFRAHGKRGNHNVLCPSNLIPIRRLWCSPF